MNQAKPLFDLKLEETANLENDAGSSTTRSAVGSARPDPANQFTIGTTLAGRYQLVQELGAGGMGRVFRALDLSSRRFCAIKCMHANLSDNDADLKRFQREASLSLKLRHDNIVEVYDVGFGDNRKPFFVMEYIQGSSLAEILEQNERLEIPDFTNIFRQVCEGISFAHGNNVVHRDIKPSNIMIVDWSGKQQVKIVDFGIAKICKTTGEICPTKVKSIQMLQLLSDPAAAVDLDSLQHLTQPGEIFGSPLYMSPEQCRGEEADCRSEVYSLGCMMFETLTGVPPLRGGTAIETVIRKLNDLAPSINEVVPGLTFPAELEYIVSRALAYDPDLRYERVDNLLAAVAIFENKLNRIAS